MFGFGGPGGRGGAGGGGGGGGGWAPSVDPATLIPPMDERRWGQFRKTVKKRTCNFFEYHRRGLSRDPTRPWDDPNNLPLFREPAAGAGPWDGRYDVDAPAALARARRAAARRGFERFAGDDDSDPETRRARRAVEAAADVVRARLARQGFTVKLVRVLGFGGNGVASLFEVWPGGADAPGRKVVVKSLLARGHDMAAERACNMALKRAPHIIQLRSWGREVMPAEGVGEEGLEAMTKRWAPIDDDNTLLTIEFMRNGDVHNFIIKLAKTKDAVPQPVLWRVFFCLVRGCIAMYSPPRSLGLSRGKVVPLAAEQWQDHFGPDLEEVLAEPPRGSDRPPPGWNLVHYDLDPQNVLIGDTDGGGHLVAPIFKISDLGLSKTLDDPMFRRPWDVMTWRRMGKTLYLLPEQHHKEWDYVQTIPSLEPTKVAGRYGEWSNIFQVGLCMQNIITKALPPYPPVAIGPLNSGEGVNLFSSPTIVCDSSGDAVPAFYTHGFSLASEPGIDEDFMLLLLRCLADLPQDRPSLLELQGLMRSMEGSPRWAVPDGDPDGVRAWCDRMFNEPAPPPASAAEVSAEFKTANSVQRPDVLATGASQHGVGNDRVPPLGGSFVVPETQAADVSWDVL